MDNPKAFYDANGYFLFREALETASITKLKSIVERDILHATQSFVRHPSGQSSPNNYLDYADGSGRKVITNPLLQPHKYEETKPLGEEILRLICNDKIFSALNSLDGEDSYTIHQIILFFTGPQTDIHIDGWFFDTLPHGHAHTLWMPLEEITLRNGPICLMPWKRGNFLDAATLGVPEFSHVDDPNLALYHSYQNALIARVHKDSGSYVLPHFDIGDFVVWSSLTPHGTLCASPNHLSRLAMQVLIRPSRLPWGGFKAPNLDTDEIRIADHWSMIK